MPAPGRPRVPSRAVTERVLPPPRRFADERRRKAPTRIARMFDAIAPTYDLLNHVLSANVDARWRRRVVALLELRGTERALDVCTGTGDLALALLEGGAREVEGCDLAEAMLDRAEEKAKGRVRFRVGDAERLPYPDAAFDVVTIGFGARNLQHLDTGLREMCRVLAPGGRLAILEFSRPPNLLVRSVYETYSTIVLPLVGNLVSGGSDNAYTYLPRSVQAFPTTGELANRLCAAGFAQVGVTLLTLGIAAIHLASKAAGSDAERA